MSENLSKVAEEGWKVNGKTSDNKEQAGLKSLLDFIESTDLEFVSIERNGRKISLKRACEPAASAKSPAASAVQGSAPAAETAQNNESPKTFSIRSPIVGRFFSSTGPDRPPLAVDGGKVTAGQRVAIVEAMKIKKEVFSAVTGTVTKIWVRDNDPVEYGQELFTVEPE